jgi:L1 cell adhesion molecule like protein
MGRRFSDKLVQNDIKNFPYKIEQGPSDKCLIVVTYKKEIRKFYPEEILTILL